MMEARHGGDIYADDLTKELLDFSASINPLGMPKTVQQAAIQALSDCVHYPDPQCRQLRRAIAAREGLMPEQVFCGNGAADVLYRLLLALRPKKILLAAPTFSEYEQAAELVGSSIVRFPLRKEDNFVIPKAFWDAVTPEIELVIVCNPNNPTGQPTSKGFLKKGMERCQAAGIRLLVDECFHDFLDEPEQVAMTDCVPENRTLILLRSFTKMYAMPGIRLGYCLSADTVLLEQLYDMGAPWSVSVLAQACGVAAAQDIEFPRQTRRYIAKQRQQLKTGLQALGFTVLPGQANYLLCHLDGVPKLVQQLRKRGILIRSCATFAGLDDSWFRIAVRTEPEQSVLLDALRQLIPKRKVEKQWQR